MNRVFGHFDDDNREYVITDPLTPSPWINYLGNTRLSAFISQQAGGLAWHIEPQNRRLTRYHWLPAPGDRPGFYVYIRDGATLWNPHFAPTCTPLDRYEGRHGVGYSQFTGEKNGVRTTVRYFIPPHDYLHRGMGFGYEPEGIGDAAVLRGKTMWIEEDTRTFSLPEQGRWNAMKGMTEVRAGLWRNLGAALSRGFNTYPMDVCGASFFMDDQIQAVLGERRRVHEAATHWDRREVPSIVMVIDDWSVLEEDMTLGYQWLAVQQQRLYGLARCGVPFQIHLLEDLAKDNFPTCHKVFLFPNLFRVTPERIALIREKVFRNGNVAIFGPAAGIHGGTTELTGIPVTREKQESPRLVTIDRFDHPITANLPRFDFGDSMPYGPLLIPGDVQRLGGIQWPQARDGVGLGIKQFADYSVIFSCAVPLPAELLREIARFSGTHVYGEADDLIFADSCSLTVHSVRPGKRSIRLPAPTPVWDMIEKRKLGELAEIRLEVAGPQTKVFYLGARPDED